ncbi:MAG TPA: M1 family metallopeptidase [Gemmata sp.]|nr:M1 family metallopeptidase [Gemmata sp.]
MRLASPRLVAALALVGLVHSSRPASADSYPRQPGVDAVHYVFRVTLGDESDEIRGETTAEFRFARDGVAEVVLDLATAANGKGMTVAEVTTGGKPVKYTHEKSQLRIELDPPAKAGERRTFTVKYRGVPAGGLWIGLNKYKERAFFSHNWPDKARQWLPVIDHPHDKATSEFVVTAPAKYQVVASGLLQEEADLGDGTRRTHWKQSVPVTTWMTALGVGQFSVRHSGPVRGVPLQTWVFRQDRDRGLATFEAPARKAVEFFSDRVGPYPYEKLASVQVAGMQASGMEMASAIFYHEGTVRGLPASSLVAHEIAHQWFGDSVTPDDWDEVWLSEGFATYFALLYSEHFDGRDAFVRGLKQSRDGIFRTERAGEKKGQRLTVVHDMMAHRRSDVPNGLVYTKGSWTLHMLRGQVGTDAFWAGIRDYYQTYRDKSTTTDDLRRVMEEHSGQKLDWFFKQWLLRSSSPVVEGGWKYNPETRKVEIELTQTQPGDPYRLPIEVAVTTDANRPPRVVKVEMTKGKQTFEIDSAAAPTAVALDPNTWLLLQATFTKR